MYMRICIYEDALQVSLPPSKDRDGQHAQSHWEADQDMVSGKRNLKMKYKPNPNTKGEILI